MYDLAIVNGTIIDTQRKRLTAANVYIKGGKIARISRETEDAAATIDASGRYVSPGFIDIHAHIEGHAANGTMLCRQGVTTALNGNCGMGVEDIGAFISNQNRRGFVINQLELCGATLLRRRVGQHDPYQPLTATQAEAANELLIKELEAGAAGLSFGLEYTPGSSKEEVLTLSRTAARYGKPVAIHIRTDCYQGLAALKEAIDIARVTGAAVQISHVVYQFGFGMMREALQMIEGAVHEGYDVSCDSGMYTSFATYIGTPVFEESCLEKWGCSYGNLFAANGRYAGQYLDRNKYDDLRKNHPDDAVIALIGNLHEIYMAFELPYMMVSSDAGVNQTDDTSKGHPQDAGTFPRFLRKLVKERAQLTLSDAVSRITLLPAKRLGLTNKGNIFEEADADLTVFDLESLTDRAKLPHKGKPDLPPEGIDAVIVNGQVAVQGGQILTGTAGRAIAQPNRPWRNEA